MSLLTYRVRRAYRSTMLHFSQLTDARHWAAAQLRACLRLHHEPEFRALRALPASTPKLFVDVGANRGQSIASMLLYHRDAKVFAFEPNPRLVQSLEHKFRRLDRVRIKAFALGDRSTSAELHIPFYGRCMVDGLASLVPTRASSWFAENALAGITPKSLRTESTQIEVRRLDDFDLRPDFVKIDVEGSELDVVVGAERTLRRWKPMLLIESAQPGTTVSNLLQDWGYRALIDKRLEASKSESLALNRVFVARESPIYEF